MSTPSQQLRILVLHDTMARHIYVFFFDSSQYSFQVSLTSSTNVKVKTTFKCQTAHSGNHWITFHVYLSHFPRYVNFFWIFSPTQINKQNKRNGQ